MRAAWDLFAEWRHHHPDLVFTSGMILFLRFWFAVLGAGSLLTHVPEMTPNIAAQYHGLAPLPTQGFWLLITPWQRWDAIWYLRIAELGYMPDDVSASFFPIFPILIRGVEIFVGSNALLANLIVSTIAMFGAFVLLYRISAELFDDATARRAVLYCAVFPTGYYMLGGYAESALVAFSLASLYFARSGHWWLAGIAAAGATLARPVGFLIALPLAIEVWGSGDAPRKKLPGLPALIIPTGAMSAWMLYLQLAFHDALLWVHAEDAWNRVFVIPGETIMWTIQNVLEGKAEAANNVTDLGLTGIAFGAILIASRKLPISFSVYALTMLLVPLLSYAQADAYRAMPMAAAGRRAVVAFPAFIALGSLWRGKWKEPLWVLSSLTLQGVLFIAFTQWYWID